MTVIWKISKIHKLFLTIYYNILANHIYMLLIQYRIITKNRIIKHKDKEIAKKRTVTQIQLINYLFIIGRSLFGYLGTYYMYTPKIVFTRNTRQTDVNTNIFYKILKSKYNKYNKIALQIVEIEHIKGIHYTKNDIKELVVSFHVTNNLENLGLINKPFISNNIIKKNSLLNIDTADNILNHVYIDKNIWKKEIALKLDYRWTKERYLANIYPKLININLLSKIYSIENWNIYKEIFGKNKEYPSNRYKEEGITKLLIQNGKELYISLNKINFWKDHYKINSIYTQTNIVYYYIVKRLISTFHNLSTLQICQNILNNHTHTNMHGILEIYKRKFLEYSYNFNMTNSHVKTLNERITLPIPFEYKNKLLINKIKKHLINTKYVIINVEDPYILQQLCRYFNYYKMKWDFFYNFSSNNQLNLYINPINNVQNKQNHYELYSIGLDRENLVVNSTLDMCLLINKRLRKENLTDYKYDYTIKEMKKKQENEQTYLVEDRKNNNVNIELEEVLLKTFRESTSPIRLYKDYQLYCIQNNDLIKHKQYLENILKMKAKDIETYIKKLETIKVINYIKKILQNPWYNKKKEHDKYEWYEYTYPIHIEHESKKIKHKDICKYYIVGKEVISRICKEKDSYSILFHHTFTYNLYAKLKESVLRITEEKNNVFNKKYTKNILRSYNKQIQEIKDILDKQIIEYSTQYRK